MSDYDTLIDELAVMAEHRDTDRAIDAMNAQMDQAIQTGLPALEVARLEALRNLMGAHRVWQGAGA
jgi:hypothetical protein